MNTVHFFDLYGRLLKTYTSEVSCEVYRKDIIVELDINDEPQKGSIEEVKHFPLDPNGNQSLHILVYFWNEINSEFKEKDE